MGHRNYLRVRGEYLDAGAGFEWVEELPPHARRIPHPIAVGGAVHGTTSACAENTSTFAKNSSMGRNYLHIRGEYTLLTNTRSKRLELPPHARRIRGVGAEGEHGLGTTSACAENTVAPHRIVSVGRNYLRVRGEYANPAAESAYGQELPPRARRIPNVNTECGGVFGTTSACAENTGDKLDAVVAVGNYLRVRGEYLHQHWFCTTE